MHGYFDHPEELRADASSALGTRLLQPLLRRLPAAWRDWPLDLHVTAAGPLPGEGSMVAPDLDLTGTARHPQLGGKLEFSFAQPRAESGAWYFSPGELDNPTASIAAISDGELKGTFYYGPRNGTSAVSWDLDPIAGGIILAPPPADGAWPEIDIYNSFETKNL